MTCCHLKEKNRLMTVHLDSSCLFLVIIFCCRWGNRCTDQGSKDQIVLRAWLGPQRRRVPVSQPSALPEIGGHPSWCPLSPCSGHSEVTPRNMWFDKAYMWAFVDSVLFFCVCRFITLLDSLLPHMVPAWDYSLGTFNQIKVSTLFYEKCVLFVYQKFKLARL